MKKILAIVFAFLLAVLIVACDKESEQSSSSEESSVESSTELSSELESESSNDTEESSSEFESESSSSSEQVKQDIVGITFDDGTFEYDTQLHTISITGNVPNGATVTYTGGENGKNGATNVGTYTIVATITADGYNTATYEATLKIKSTEEALAVHTHNGTVYFQNYLDKKTMYTYGGTDVERLNRDNPVCMITVGADMFYINSNLLSKSISVLDSEGNVSDLFDVSAEQLASDGTYLYYNVNSLTSSEKTGIYKIRISDLKNSETDAVPTKLTGVKSEYLVYSNGYVYFSNKSDGGKLYAISVSANNATPILIYDFKVTDTIESDGVIYFTRQITLSNLTSGAAIYSIDVSGGLNSEVDDESSKVNKITMSKGKYLAKIGDYIYFVNTDMVTSTIFGDGIYRAPADGSGWLSDTFELLIGSTKIVDGENDNLYALSSDGAYLYYFRANTKHLYRYDVQNNTELDLMQGFEPPVYETAILTYYEKATVYNGEIYFINMNDGGKLYKYNIANDAEYRITGTQVADFAIYDGNLYYTTVKLLVNFDLYKMSLTNGEPERLSTEKCMNISFSGSKMYYTNYSGDNTLNSMNLDGTEDTILYGDPDKDEESVGDGETAVYEGYVYFVANDLLYRYSITNGTSEIVDENLKPLEYLIYNDKILVMNCDGLKNHVDVYDINTKETTKLTDLGISGVSDDARGMFVYNGDFYYYRNVAAGSSDKGLYRVYLDGSTYKQELVNKLDGYYMCESMVIGDKIYFLDVWQVKDSVPTGSSTASLYSIDMSQSTITVTKEN